MAFIFLIVVVLMNLLNGLAVSDIGLIREEAEVLSLKSQVRDQSGDISNVEVKKFEAK